MEDARRFLFYDGVFSKAERVYEIQTKYETL